jgi:hypothetical protein
LDHPRVPTVQTQLSLYHRYPSLELFPRIRKVGESINEIEDPATPFSSEFEIETQVEMLSFSCFFWLFLGFLLMVLLS